MRKVNKELYTRAREHIKRSSDYSLVKFVQENITKEVDMSGRNPKCSCPFHGTDSRPSFSIVAEEYYFQCFGCGKAGDIIDLMRFWEEKATGRLPSSSFIIEKILNNDPKVRLDLKMTTIYVGYEKSYDEVLSKVRRDFKPSFSDTIHTLPLLKGWMFKNDMMTMDNIKTAVTYSQKGMSPDIIRKILIGEMVNDVIIENLSEYSLEDYGLDLEEEFDL